MIALFWITPCTLAAQDPDESVIDSFISRQAHREHGEEYRNARQVVTGELTHDGIPDTVVLYTIEGQDGTNNYIQYLAVFVRSKGVLAAEGYAEVGGKSYRTIELISVDDHTIHLQTLNYTQNDPACCPSKKGETRYILKGHKLRELKRPHAQGRHNPQIY